MVCTTLPHRLRKFLDENELIIELEATKFTQTINDTEWEKSLSKDMHGRTQESFQDSRLPCKDD